MLLTVCVLHNVVVVSLVVVPVVVVVGGFVFVAVAVAVAVVAMSKQPELDFGRRFRLMVAAATIASAAAECTPFFLPINK